MYALNLLLIEIAFNAVFVSVVALAGAPFARKAYLGKTSLYFKSATSDFFCLMALSGLVTALLLISVNLHEAHNQMSLVLLAGFYHPIYAARQAVQCVKWNNTRKTNIQAICDRIICSGLFASGVMVIFGASYLTLTVCAVITITGVLFSFISSVAPALKASEQAAA